MDELIAYDAIALGELIRKGEISSIELLNIIIERIEKVNPQLNAVIHKMYDQARTAAEALSSDTKVEKPSGSEFWGVPFLLKDLVAECKGTPFNEGSRAVQNYISKLDSELVRRHKAGGLIIIGKTNAAEFGVLPTTEPAIHGPTVNPWDPSLTPGGSSGGSAAAVAAGIVPMAHGNDGGGSLRIPASCCGLFGLKPTRGRNPLGPLFGDIGGGMSTQLVADKQRAVLLTELLNGFEKSVYGQHDTHVAHDRFHDHRGDFPAVLFELLPQRFNVAVLERHRRIGQCLGNARRFNAGKQMGVQRGFG